MDDWTILIRNALAVLIILLAIAVVTFLAFLGLNSANRSGDKLSESVAVIDARTMETYDQKTVSGTTALSAIKAYQKRAIAVIVRNNSTTVNYNAYLAKKTDTTAEVHNGTVKYPIVLGTGATQYGTTNKDTANPVGLIAPSGVAAQNNCQNLDVSKATASHYSQYINPNAKFRSVMIYSVNGEIIGIYLEQTTAGGILKF